MKGNENSIIDIGYGLAIQSVTLSDCGLLAGKAGVGLLLFELAKHTGHQKFESHAFRLIEESLIAQCDEQKSLDLELEAIHLFYRQTHNIDSVELAIDMIDEAIRLDSMHRTAYSNKVQFLQWFGEFGLAYDVMREAKAKFPEDSSIPLTMGNMMELRSDTVSAQRLYREAQYLWSQTDAFDSKKFSDVDYRSVIELMLYCKIYIDINNVEFEERDREAVKRTIEYLNNFDRTKFFNQLRSNSMPIARQ